jgi:hypothetical protein
VAKLALLQSTAQEALLQGTQQTRTLSESAANIGSATLLGGMLGAAGHALAGLPKGIALDADVRRCRCIGSVGTRGRRQPLSYSRFER